MPGLWLLISTAKLEKSWKCLIVILCSSMYSLNWLTQVLEMLLSIINKNWPTKDSSWSICLNLNQMSKSLNKTLKDFKESIKKKSQSLRTWSETRALSLRIKFTLNLIVFHKFTLNFLKRKIWLISVKIFSEFSLNLNKPWLTSLTKRLLEPVNNFMLKRLTT